MATQKVFLFGGLIFLTCGFNNFSLELMLARDKGFGPLLTLCQFVFIGMEGLLEHFDFSTMSLKPRSIPLSFYVWFAVLFGVIQFMNNISYGFNVAQPLVLCVRSSSLISSFALGMIFRQRFGSVECGVVRFVNSTSVRYTIGQLAGVLLVTVGVILTVLADAALHVCAGCSITDGVSLASTACARD
jgi:UDP-xylose/UDP-N-acetylglucosamine transporter B4